MREAQPQVSLEFYLISSGIGDVVRATPIAREFTGNMGFGIHLRAETGGIEFPRLPGQLHRQDRAISSISRKASSAGNFGNKPFEVNRKVPEDRLRVPFDQMVFVGDGYTDIPCFSLIRGAGGIAFGVWDPRHRDKRSRAWGFIEEGRVSNLNHARYDENAELYQLLEEAVTSLAHRIALKSRVYRG